MRVRASLDDISAAGKAMARFTNGVPTYPVLGSSGARDGIGRCGWDHHRLWRRDALRGGVVGKLFRQ